MLTQTLVSYNSKKYKLLCTGKQPLNDRHWPQCKDLANLYTQPESKIDRSLEVVSSQLDTHRRWLLAPGPLTVL